VIVPGHILLYCSSCKYYKIKDVLLFLDIYFCTAAPANITKSRICDPENILLYCSSCANITKSRMCDCSRTYPSVLQLLQLLHYINTRDNLSADIFLLKVV